MPYPTKPKGGWQRPRQVVVNKSMAQLREKKATRKFMNKYQEIIQNSMAQGSFSSLYKRDSASLTLSLLPSRYFKSNIYLFRQSKRVTSLVDIGSCFDLIK